MPPRPQTAEKLVFGCFEVNLATAEVFRRGRKLRLSGQPAQVLVILLQRAGQLVTREELHLLLWPEETFVDFDHGLNNCINRIREVLGDSATVPEWIETLPKRGYRFVAPVRLVEEIAEESRKQPEPPVAPGIEASRPQTRSSPFWTTRRRWLAFAIVIFATVAVLGTAWWMRQRDYFWKNPLDGAKIERLTDFEGDEFDADISPDGKFAIFSSDRSGQLEVWLTQVGSGEFANITKGGVPGPIPNNRPVRTIGFSGDGTQVWSSQFGPDLPGKAKTWIGPTLGGTFRPFLEMGIEPAWSPDGSRVVYHTPEAGDPIYIADRDGNNPKLIFAEKPGVHCHFPIWSPDGQYIYFVKGTFATEETDIWRISASTPSQVRAPERITYQNANVGYLNWLDSRTLVYSASADDGSGQWLYSIDVERRIPHRISSGLEDQYLTVSVSKTHPRRLIASVARPTATLWTIPISDKTLPESSAARFPVPNVRALGPRFGPGYLLFLSGRGGGDGLWRLDGGVAWELWKGGDGGLVAPASISPDGGRVCFTYRKEGRATLNMMSATGTGLTAIAPSLDARGGVSWSPDGKWIAVSADRGDGTHLFKVPAGGGEPVQLVDALSYNPVWSPDGKLIVYSGQESGGIFVLKAVTPDKSPVPVPPISVVFFKGSLYRFLPGQNALIVLESDFRKENFFRVDLNTGEQRALTDLQADYRVQSFDISPDGKQILFDRVRRNADAVVMSLTK